MNKLFYSLVIVGTIGCLLTLGKTYVVLGQHSLLPIACLAVIVVAQCIGLLVKRKRSQFLLATIFVALPIALNLAR